MGRSFHRFYRAALGVGTLVGMDDKKPWSKGLGISTLALIKAICASKWQLLKSRVAKWFK